MSELLSAATVRHTARTIANAYERVRFQQPRLSHDERLQALLPGDGASRLPGLWNAVHAQSGLGLNWLASELILADGSVSSAGSRADAGLIRELVDDEVRQTLGYVPDGSEESAQQTRARDAWLRTDEGYRRYLESTFGIGCPTGRPDFSLENAVLQSGLEWEEAGNEVYRLGLPAHFQGPKNWDGLAAISCVLRRTDASAAILEAGTELYSVVLPSLFLYGYKNLTGINLVFEQPCALGPISYEPGDITTTRFEANTFDAITCLSVIEHGVDVRAYFREMARVLKPGAVLITSTDYYSSPVDTKGAVAYGVPVRIFSQDDILTALTTATECGLELTGALDLNCRERPVSWPELSLDYTFIIFTLQKRAV
jgi:SAM-dependent methyltransferase